MGYVLPSCNKGWSAHHSVDHSPFFTFSGTIDLLVNLTISTSNVLLVSIALWTWSKSLRSDWFLAGIHSDFWSTSVQVIKSLVSASSFGKETPFIFWNKITTYLTSSISLHFWNDCGYHSGHILPFKKQLYIDSHHCSNVFLMFSFIGNLFEWRWNLTLSSTWCNGTLGLFGCLGCYQ